MPINSPIQEFVLKWILKKDSPRQFKLISTVGSIFKLWIMRMLLLDAIFSMSMGTLQKVPQKLQHLNLLLSLCHLLKVMASKEHSKQFQGNTIICLRDLILTGLKTRNNLYDEVLDKHNLLEVTIIQFVVKEGPKIFDHLNSFNALLC